MKTIPNTRTAEQMLAENRAAMALASALGISHGEALTRILRAGAGRGPAAPKKPAPKPRPRESALARFEREHAAEIRALVLANKHREAAAKSASTRPAEYGPFDREELARRMGLSTGRGGCRVEAGGAILRLSAEAPRFSRNGPAPSRSGEEIAREAQNAFESTPAPTDQRPWWEPPPRRPGDLPSFLDTTPSTERGAVTHDRAELRRRMGLEDGPRVESSARRLVLR